MRYADFMWGLERNTQHEDEDLRQFSCFRVLKDRLTGQSTGKTFWLKYNDGRLFECEAPQTEGDVAPEASAYDF